MLIKPSILIVSTVLLGVLGYVTYTWPMPISKSYTGLIVTSESAERDRRVPVHLKGTLQRHVFRESTFKGRLLVNDIPMEISSCCSENDSNSNFSFKGKSRPLKAWVHRPGFCKDAANGIIVFDQDFNYIGGKSPVLNKKYQNPEVYFAAPASTRREAESFVKSAVQF